MNKRNKLILRKKKFKAVFEPYWWRILKSILRKIFWLPIYAVILFFVEYTRVAFILLCTLIFAFSIYNIVQIQNVEDNYYSECGVVEDKVQTSDEDGDIKHYMFIRYDKDKGDVVKESVSNSTYYNKDKGDRICFDRIKDGTGRGWWVTTAIIVAIVGISLIASAFDF